MQINIKKLYTSPLLKLYIFKEGDFILYYRIIKQFEILKDG